MEQFLRQDILTIDWSYYLNVEPLYLLGSGRRERIEYLTYSSTTSFSLPANLANSSMASSRHTVESTSKQTASADRNIVFTACWVMVANGRTAALAITAADGMDGYGIVKVVPLIFWSFTPPASADMAGDDGVLPVGGGVTTRGTMAGGGLTTSGETGGLELDSSLKSDPELPCRT